MIYSQNLVLHQAMRRLRVNYRQLAERIGVEPQEVLAWLRAEPSPNSATAGILPQQIQEQLRGYVDYQAALTPLSHLLSVDIFTRERLERLFCIADMMQPIARRRLRTSILSGAVLGCLFFEASTRTRLSFSAAFARMGGAVISATNFNFSSMAKGESIADTSRVLAGYTDAVVVRHPEEGAVAEYALHSHVPVINGGDGPGEHPSQALLDVYTIENEFLTQGKTIDGSTITVIGDLRYGRTVHSLLKLLKLYDNLTFRLFSAPDLQLPAEVAELVTAAGHRLRSCSTLAEAIADTDVIYATRIQKERFKGEIDLGSEYRLTRELVDRCCRPDILILHPLPRDARAGACDLGTDLDSHPGMAIFRQADNGVAVRMAIFSELLGVTGKITADTVSEVPWAV